MWRKFSLLVLIIFPQFASGFVPPRQTAATIEIRPDEPLGPRISRRLFGKFTEHLGRNVYGGAWAQILDNPGFEPEERWGHPAELRQRLAGIEQGVSLPGLAAAPDSGLAPFWAPLDEPTADYALQPQGINGWCQQLTAHAPMAGLRTFVFLPLHRTRAYEISIWVYNTGTHDNALRFSLYQPSQPTAITSVGLNVPSTGWQQLRFQLVVPDTVVIEKGQVLHLWLTLEQPGTVRLDQCFVFPSDHVDGWDAEVVDYLRAARLPLLRFPGGNFVSGYHWRDGVGPVDSRPVLPNPAWFGVEWNHVGTDEWLRLCEMVGAEPLICVNAGNGTPEEAAAWVEYCNGDTTTPMGRLRAQNGHPQPYGVKLWEIGNELYGSWQIGHTDAAGYAERYADFYLAMTAVDPTIDFIACGFDADWNRTVVQRNAQTVRSFSVHTLPGYGITGPADPREVYLELMGFLAGYAAELRSRAAPMVEAGITPRLAITEIQTAVQTRDLPNQKTLTEALWMAGIYNLGIRSKGAIELITHSALVNHGGGLEKRFGVVYAHPVWWATHLYSTMTGTQPVAVKVTGPTFNTEGKWFPAASQVPYLDAVALLDSTGAELTLLVTNRHPDSTLVARIRLPGFLPAHDALLSVLTGDNFMAQNTWDKPEVVTIAESTVAVDSSFDHPFPPLSLNVFTLRRRDVTEVEETPGSFFRFELAQNYPNPFNPTTRIRYWLPRAAAVQLQIFNLRGQRVATLVDERQEAGLHEVEWQPGALSSGMYVYRLQAGKKFVATRKLVLLK